MAFTTPTERKPRTTWTAPTPDLYIWYLCQHSSSRHRTCTCTGKLEYGITVLEAAVQQQGVRDRELFPQRPRCITGCAYPCLQNCVESLSVSHPQVQKLVWKKVLLQIQSATGHETWKWIWFMDNKRLCAEHRMSPAIRNASLSRFPPMSHEPRKKPYSRYPRFSFISPPLPPSHFLAGPVYQ